MKKQELVLLQLMEEAAEVQHRISKLLRFGIDEEYDGESNLLALKRELMDFDAVILYLMDNYEEFETLGHVDVTAIHEKHAKIEKYLEHSQSQGTLEETPLGKAVKDARGGDAPIEKKGYA